MVTTTGPVWISIIGGQEYGVVTTTGPVWISIIGGQEYGVVTTTGPLRPLSKFDKNNFIFFLLIPTNLQISNLLE